MYTTLVQCGMTSVEVGTTYMADHAQKNGEIAESSIDHVYASNSLTENIQIFKLKTHTPFNTWATIPSFV